MALDQPSIQRNVTIQGHRTSVRLRSVEWEALVEIARREGRTISDVVAEIDHRRGAASLAAALRVFAVGYFKILAEHRETEGIAVPTSRLLPAATGTGTQPSWWKAYGCPSLAGDAAPLDSAIEAS